ncbi:unnamed protein product [Spirodela intermedia]|uniref:Serine/threonine protein phosphatase 2A regulatory subunit n=1 Tax=Spirodela intermedia TaxID=51605 RepID=A0A7I8L4I4_SPIIN|nr:unnamed protein product [Spirodela intermedia]
MIKQILGRLPRKSSRSGEHGKDSGGRANASAGARTRDSKLVDNLQPISNPVADDQADGNPGFPSTDVLTRFGDVSAPEKHSLFVRKLNLCCVVFDFTDPTKDLQEKETKRGVLRELVDYVASAGGKFPEVVVQEVMKMVSCNLFRATASPPREIKVPETFDLEDEEPAMDPGWPHLQLVYEFFLLFVASPETDTKMAKRFIDQSFVLRLLDLFDSEDPRERDCLKMVLHRIYGKFMAHRPFIRKAINNIFYQFIFETERHNGIAEILEILGSIINGFALPLKDEHKLFLVRALIPLHKPKSMGAYHQQLSYCITQFMEKDSNLAVAIIRGLLKYWPVTNSSKEVMFLGEMEEILEMTQPAEFESCMVPLFCQIARCLNSLHSQVAERALLLWNNDHISGLIKQNHEVVLPIVFPALERNKTHWNLVVRNLSLTTRRFFSNQDSSLFDECLEKFQRDQADDEGMKSKRDAAWRHLEEMAASRDSNRSLVAVS